MNKFKKVALASVAALAIISLAACGKSTSTSSKAVNASSNLDKKQTINVWTFTDLKPQLTELKKLKPNLTIKEVVLPYANFQTKLDQVIGTSKGPDMIALDAGFVEKYVESGKLTDLAPYGVAKAAKANYKYTLDMGKNSKGQQVSISYQAAPGAYFYNTQVFSKYLGIQPDDIASAQKALSSWDQIEKTAQTIKEKSGGQAYLFSSLEEIYNPVIGARKEGWVSKDNKLQIDSSMLKSLDVMKDFVANKWTQNTSAQSGDWFTGMSNNTIGTYALPSWGMFYWLKDDSKGTFGNWRMTQGPVSYSWGGTWLSAVKGSANEKGAAALSVYMSTDKTFQTWEAKTQSDFVAVSTVNNTVGKDASVKLLGGQNPYPIFNKVAKGINGKNQTQYDQNIQSLWINDVVNPYANGKVSKDKALKNFKNDVKSAYPSMTVN
ncbi:ABC transporter substrate-binding protein [Lactococcus kimchii]|uniref:ABC transporter substrate-binding protein n=1 Tax=Lactococcus sp. S-13 TaxID=2507158 RepID=UPI001022F17D|nr:sugar ABC transporter substrate-binding protein [Lactococcus sp. S-13]RZI48080.1 sugar ABC transporter substrate-binding protein [Lactococcus sp. S-13]